MSTIYLIEDMLLMQAQSGSVLTMKGGHARAPGGCEGQCCSTCVLHLEYSIDCKCMCDCPGL